MIPIHKLPEGPKTAGFNKRLQELAERDAELSGAVDRIIAETLAGTEKTPCTAILAHQDAVVRHKVELIAALNEKEAIATEIRSGIFAEATAATDKAEDRMHELTEQLNEIGIAAEAVKSAVAADAQRVELFKQANILKQKASALGVTKEERAALKTLSAEIVKTMKEQTK